MEREREVYENLVALPTSASKVIFTLYRRQGWLKGGNDAGADYRPVCVLGSRKNRA